MLKRRTAALLLLASLVLNSFPAFAQQPTPTPAPQAPAPGQQQPALDPNDPVAKIIDEGMNRSQVMQTLSYLSDVIGPRLTGSPGMKRANEWTRDQLTKWGLQNAKVEPWGTFGRGWALKRFSAEVVEPQAIPLIAYPKAWSPATTGPVVADVVYVDAKDEAEMRAKYAGKLKGAIVLTGAMREDIKAHFDPQGTRLNEKQLLDLANAPDPALRPQRRGGFPQQSPEQRAAAAFNAAKQQFYLSEGAALLVDPGRGDGGTVFVSAAAVPQAPAPPGAPAFGPGAPRRFSAYDKDAPKFLPQIVMASEQYNRLVRMIQAGEKVRMAVNLDAQYLDQDPLGYNTIAEIPGSDPQLKDEIVMLGGHMDSWHAGTGATDNGAGVSVAMEAVRIIQTLGLKPRRTIRIGLWSGEEQGLLGSRGYVKQHFGEIVAPTPQPTPPGAGEGRPQAAPTPTPQGRLVTKPDYEKFSGYFNLDNGTGKIRGVYMQGNAGVWPIFRQWLAPFSQMGAQTLSMSNTGGTDHLAFDAVGLPGFQFIQDEIEYDTRTHHSNQDVFDRIQGDDMKQAATIMAAFVYQTAQRDEKLPRKPAPPR
ncbi:MAG: M20/M25/M40 family metallo-hydrolase [Acidobacteria bacterium]|nr:M20/M25/M40 family metallo-hydrolase [Acidobacteriota bacterium]MCA1641544.1 M20/M25/M40 family metallo-hydrolase [Acidobacteriota bacterium]